MAGVLNAVSSIMRRSQGRQVRAASYSELYPPPRSGATRVLPSLQPHPALGVDVDQTVNGLRNAAGTRCSPERDIVVITTDWKQLDIAVNLVANLADVGVHHYLVITNSEDLCRTISDKLACVWTSVMTQYKQKLREAGTNVVRALWLVRQIYLGRLIRMSFNPMLLDADVVLFRNPFPLIRAHLPGYQAIFLGDTSAGYMSANGGTVYVRGAARDGPVVQIWRNFERRVFELLNTSAKFPEQTFHKTRRGMVGGPGVPADALLYDQNVLDWSIVGQIIGDPGFVGRGFSSTMRQLDERERAMIAWKVEREVRFVRSTAFRQGPAHLTKPEPPGGTSLRVDCSCDFSDCVCTRFLQIAGVSFTRNPTRVDRSTRTPHVCAMHNHVELAPAHVPPAA